ncbi:hypothetical protein ACIQ4I_11935 [Rummeliibacillus sp. NPDC094406]|uniref:hypothetical protein n=1 Tax=Rummeliibacillus sp. NPDC094406 TaxID=3364511 RepID=UPI0038264176
MEFLKVFLYFLLLSIGFVTFTIAGEEINILHHSPYKQIVSIASPLLCILFLKFTVERSPLFWLWKVLIGIVTLILGIVGMVELFTWLFDWE